MSRRDVSWTGRRWSDGLHQAVEAKEHVKVRGCYPDFCHDHPAELLPYVPQAGRYDRYGRNRGRRSSGTSTSWMSWSIPTNRPIIRDDHQDDRIYKTKREKYNAVIEEIDELVEAGSSGARRYRHRWKSPNLLSRMLTLREHQT